MSKLTIDFESRSTVDLRKTNAWVYAEHPSTQIMCLAFKEDGQLPGIWVPPSVTNLYNMADLMISCPPEFYFEPYKEGVLGCLDDADIIEAHNLEFEIALWTCKMVPLGFPDLRQEPYFSKLRCSAAAAAMQALPRALGNAGAALDLNTQKDKAGHSLMMKMCKPRKPRKAEREADPDWESKNWWHEEPQDLLRQAIYCARDVDAEHALSSVLRGLPEDELQVWRLDQKANWHGVVVDQDLCRKMITVRDDYLAHIKAEFKSITGFSPSQNVKLAQWLTTHGVQTDTVDKERIEELLDFNDRCQAGPIKRALEIRQQFAKTSLAKLDTALNSINSDGRMRSNLMYHGASTGRWSGKGMQLQNLPSRNLIKTIGTCTDLLRGGADLQTISMVYGDEVQLALSSCIRGVLRSAPGKQLYAADFSSIEGRVLAWLANDQHIIQGYIDGLDMYKVAASSVYGKSYDQITKSERQVGKIPELGGGYGGGWRAYANFARKEKLRCPPEIVAKITEADYWDWWVKKEDRTEANRFTQQEAEYCKWFSPIVQAWRNNRPGTVALWRGLEDACKAAVKAPGSHYSYNGIWFCVDREDFLRIRLPSKRVLYYYRPRIGTRRGKEQIYFMGNDSVKNRWGVIFTYGGKLVENVVQAIARDLMREAMIRIDEANLGIDLLFTVHDEIVEEGPAGAITQDQFESLMAVVPDWAVGCPIGAEGWIGEYYRK